MKTFERVLIVWLQCITFEIKTMDKKDVIIHARISDDENQKLIKESNKKDIPKAQIIREGIKLYFESNNRS